MAITAILVNFNDRLHLGPCLDSLRAELGEGADIIVVDNASSDGSAEFLASAYPAVRTIANTDNRGFGAANNQALAAATGSEIKRVVVRSQRSRWGSCSARGTISLNWRLIQAPDFVRDYIIYHELAHLREMNHSVRFWARVETLCPEWRAAERWLKHEGSLLGL